MRHPLLWILVLGSVAVSAPAPASAQLVYIDTNGDGLASCTDPSLPGDVLGPSTTSVDVYFATNRNDDGTTATCNASPEPLTINSYEILLTWSGDGQVLYGSWTNNMPGFTVNLTGGPGGVLRGERDIWIGLGSGNALPPNRYKVGTLTLQVEGNPVLTWITSSPLHPAAETAFGSLCEGVDFSNTCTLGKDFTNAGGTEEPEARTRVSTTWEKIETLYR